MDDSILHFVGFSGRPLRVLLAGWAGGACVPFTNATTQGLCMTASYSGGPKGIARVSVDRLAVRTRLPPGAEDRVWHGSVLSDIQNPKLQITKGPTTIRR